MDVGRLTLRAAAAMRLQLRIICTVCGRASVSPASMLAYDRNGDRRLGGLRLTCSDCGHQDVEILEDRPNLTAPASAKDLPFTVEEWDLDDRHIVEVIAATRNAMVAQAAFDAAVTYFPEKRILLRHRCHLMRTHVGTRPAGGDAR